jgi:hypothetical protein
MTKRVSTLLIALVILLTGCGARARPTPEPIYVTATPLPVLETPTPEITDVLGATAVFTDGLAVLPTFPTATFTPFPTNKPTLTPSFTPSATESPTPKGTKTTPKSPVNCPTAAQGGFATIYAQDVNLQAQLGCPVAPPIPVNSATLAFENGSMVWASQYGDSPGKVIYVLYANGSFQRFSDVWTEGVHPEHTGEVAPQGLNAPGRGFGKIWHDNQAVKTALGWALNTEVGTGGQLQRFERGEMYFIAAVNQTYIFIAGANQWRTSPIPF